MWKKWNIKYSLALHPLQIAITLRGLKLLKVGGRLVYSTCSLNPIEDEAVVMALLRRCGGAVRIVDVRDRYPKLRRAAGLFHWEVVDGENTPFPRFDAIPAENRRLYRESMFPPSEEACRSAHLEWAMRFLPHHQDTGGFFVCVLEKTAEIPKLDREEDEENADETPKENGDETPKEEGEKSQGMEEEKNETPKENETPQKEDEEEEEEANELMDGDLVGIVKDEQQYVDFPAVPA